jgi:hypothetical protein
MRSTHSFTLGAALLCVLGSTNAYKLVDTFDSTNFFDEFSFFTGTDPTQGYVDYVSESAANNSHLVRTQNNHVNMGLDYTTKNPSGGRKSVRVSSNKAYSK